MSILIDIPAALVASPRPCAPLADVRRYADDAQPRLRTLSVMTTASMAWRALTGSTQRGFETNAAQHTTQDGRTATSGAYVAKQHFSIRSGPPTSRPPA